jgi:hypothetical protein
MSENLTLYFDLASRSRDLKLKLKPLVQAWEEFLRRLNERALCVKQNLLSSNDGRARGQALAYVTRPKLTMKVHAM